MAHHETELLGSIVAFEGRPDTIYTQLRLLPTSPQLLILPSIQCNFSDVHLEQNFDARAYIKRVHEALVARNETARAFLKASTPTNKRLVFMNGGTPSAQALCIKAIMAHETAGNKEEASLIFDSLIMDGVAGLHENRHRREGSFDDSDESGEFEDPITRAMRAADALDRQTANLQPSEDHDLTTSTRQRSSSLPLYGYSDAFGDAAPFFVFGARTPEKDGQVEEGGSVAPRKPSLVLSQPDDLAQRPVLLNPWTRTSIPNSPSCIGETYEPCPHQDRVDVDASSPMSEVFSIKTLDNVVYGEAAVLDVRRSVSARGSLARVRSLDRIYPTSSRLRDLFIPVESWLAEPDTPKLHRPRSLMVFRDDRDTPWHRLSIVDRPRTVMVKTKNPVVKVEPVPPEKKRKRHIRASSTYVDRGTDPDTDPDRQAYSQPVFPFAEDLVVFFKEETADRLLAEAIGAFRDGHYPILPVSPKTAESVEDAEKLLPGTPSSHSSEAPRHCSNAPEPEEEIIASASADVDDYDPFAYVQPSTQPPKSSPVTPKVTVVRPPTPAQTPPPSVTVAESERKVHEFSIAANQTAVAVQNSLRSVLAEYFPPDTQGYHQFQFSLLPEFDGLWKPIRDTDFDCPQKGEGNCRQILAIGSQKGVKKEYSLAITGQLESLGNKSSDLGRADIVDFRYLLANAMQAFTAQPLANQTSDNPFTNSYLLATLIVPHLETYLALHSEVRYLLLQYPPEHLGTVLALQKLVGVDLMKVAQIVDSNSKEHLPFTHIRGVSIGNKSEANPTKRTSPCPSPSTAVPVSKANFLLTSTASDKDIAKFVSTVWNIEADLGDSETSEPSVHGSSTRKGKPPPLSLSRENLAPLSRAGPHSPVSPKTVTASPHQPTSAVRPDSANNSVRTSKTGRSNLSRRKSRGNASIPATDAASLVSYDPADDSDYDLDESRLMPLFLRKTGTRKPNSRKALKFLGLA